MNPNTVRGQAVASSAFLVALAVLNRPAVAMMLAATGLTWWLALNALYAHALRRQPRHCSAAPGRTHRRWKGDRNMARQVIVANVIPMLVAIVLLETGVSLEPDLGPIQLHYVQGIVATFAVTLIVWIGSSHVDWYYIRPRVDGVVRDPPCQSSGEATWKGVTRTWYRHRAVASVATMLGAVTLALLVTLMLDRQAENLLAAIGGFNAIVAVALWLMRDEIQAVAATREAIRSTTYNVGDDVRYDTDFWRRRGYVLHVSVPKTKLVSLEHGSGAVELPPHRYEEPSVDLHKVRLDAKRFTGCSDGCLKLNPECTAEVPRPHTKRPRFLVI